MLLGGWFKQNDLAFGVAYWILADYFGERKGVWSTKSYVPISHPGRDLQWLKCGKSSMLVAGEQVPDNGSLANIIGDHEPPSPPLAHIIHRYELHVVIMMRESSLDGKSVVV